MNRRVVITGIGPVTQLGIGVDKFEEGLKNPFPISIKIPKSIKDNYSLTTSHYIPAVDIDNTFNNNMNFLSYENSFLLNKAAMLAIEDSKLKITENNNIAVEIGIGIGYTRGIYENTLAYISNKKVDKLVSPKSMPNAPAAWLSINFGLYGSNNVINAACASSTYAVGEAFRKIKDGYNDCILCGGLEYLKDSNLTFVKNFEMLTVLSRTDTGIPFSNQQSGFIYNEGAACCLILEDYESALKRKAPIYCEITGYESSCDAHSLLAIEPSGEKIKRMLSTLVKDKKIEYYNSHGTGTKTNNVVESNVIKEVFGDKNKQPFINSTKGILGHSFGASGAIEAAVCALSIKNKFIHKNTIMKSVENFNLVSETKYCNVRNAISASFGFGGHNAAILFEECVH